MIAIAKKSSWITIYSRQLLRTGAGHKTYQQDESTIHRVARSEMEQAMAKAKYREHDSCDDRQLQPIK